MIPEKLKGNVLARSGGACSICGRRDVPLEIDHIIPLAMSGTDALDNLRVVCRSCHVLAHASNLKIEDLKKQARGSYELEQRVVEMLREAGFAVLAGATGPDAGVDIISYGIEADTNRPISLLIECKRSSAL